MRIARAGCATVIAAILAVRCFYAHPAPVRAWFDNLPRPLIMAHQGGEKQWPSNTMLAFREAKKLGADVLDMDVHLTRDGELVLMHDTTVERTTDGQGAIREMTWEQLARLDAGYRFSLDGKTYPYRARGLRIPRLEEVFREFPDIRLGIEIKQAPAQTVTRLADLIHRYHAEDRVLLAGFEEAMMAEQRRRLPGAATTATPNEVRMFWIASYLHLESFTAADYSVLQIPLDHKGQRLVTARLVEAAHSRGIRVLPWTLDSDPEVEVARAAGCDGFNTNLPGPMLKYRHTWSL